MNDINNSLLTTVCAACQVGSPLVTKAELDEYLPQILDWSVLDINGTDHLVRTYKFPDFATAIAFTNQVGELADSENHHPEIVTEWGKVRVSWWTHKINGLHLNDLVLAAKTDVLVN